MLKIIGTILLIIAFCYASLVVIELLYWFCHNSIYDKTNIIATIIFTLFLLVTITICGIACLISNFSFCKILGVLLAITSFVELFYLQVAQSDFSVLSFILMILGTSIVFFAKN